MKTEIFMHCSATRPEWMRGLGVHRKTAEIRRWHVEDNGWSDIAYAAVIDLDGEHAWGRDLDGDGDVWEEIAAAARGHNRSGVHICLIGGFGSRATDDFFDHFTAAQDQKARELIEQINRHFGRKLTVRGHNEVARKECPGFNAKKWYAAGPKFVRPDVPPIKPKRPPFWLRFLRRLFG